MNNQLSKVGKKVLSSIVSVVFVLCLTILPSIVFGQNPGDNPDAVPQAVPLNATMNLLLLAVGAFLAVNVIRKGIAKQHPRAIPA